MSHRSEWPYPHAGCYQACPGEDLLIVSPVFGYVVMVKGRLSHRFFSYVAFSACLKGMRTGLNGYILIMSVTKEGACPGEL